MSIVKSAIEVGIRPRCHFEDITRADFYGFVVPFAIELRKLMEESGVPSRFAHVTPWAMEFHIRCRTAKKCSGNNLWTQTLCRFPERAYRMARSQ